MGMPKILLSCSFLKTSTLRHAVLLFDICVLENCDSSVMSRSF